MPVKRRLSKSRKELDNTDLEDLFYGPGTCLFNGAGYLGAHNDGFWRDKSPDVQAAVLAEMREDWERHRSTILTAWQSRSPHDLYIAREYHGDPAEPWAQQQFEREETR
jgi:hypothetical protein